MIIYNTTFHVENDLTDEFLHYVKQKYIPLALKQGNLKTPRLSEVLSVQEDQNGRSFSLQFSVNDMDAFDSWLEQTGEHLLNKLLAHFQKRVLFFSTFLEEISLTQ